MHLMNAVILSARRSRQAGYRTNDSLALARHQPAASLANEIAGARKLLASAANAELHQLACIVKAVALYTNRLAPGFNIDSRERQAQFYQSSNCQEPNFRALAVESDRELTSTPNNSYGTLAKTIKTIN